MAESERESKDSLRSASARVDIKGRRRRRRGERRRRGRRRRRRGISIPRRGPFPPTSFPPSPLLPSPPRTSIAHRSNVFAVLSREILQLEFIAVVTKRLLPSCTQLLLRSIFSSLFVETTTTTTTTTDSATSEKPSDHPPGSSLPASVSAFKGLYSLLRA